MVIDKFVAKKERERGGAITISRLASFFSPCPLNRPLEKNVFVVFENGKEDLEE